MQPVAYVDESGNDGMDLQRPQVSTHYVVTALLFEADDLEAALQPLHEARRKYFRGEEMKSEKLTDDLKRNMVLQTICAAPFRLYSLVISKDKLTSIGFQYPSTLVKNLHGRLYRRVLDDFPNVKFIADRIKGQPFTQQVGAYLEKQNISTLFNPWSQEHVDSKDYVGVQAADVIGGTIRLCFETNPDSPQTDHRMAPLRIRSEAIDRFPLLDDSRTASSHLAKKVWDREIEERAMSDVVHFVERFARDCNEDIRLQVTCANLLLERAGGEWVQTFVIQSCLENIALEPVSEQKLRNVIGKLRDQSLLIASRSAGGYRIATCHGDLVESINRQNSQIVPMLARAFLVHL